MKPYERLAEVFDRGLASGIDSLDVDERELYLIQDFIIDYEMGGLSPYFYNRLPDLDRIGAAIAAMRRFGLNDLATLLAEAADLFRGYTDPDPPTTWGEVLRRYDPDDRLSAVDNRIERLDHYGLSDSTIA
jgi:hypothetical protein